MSNASIPAEKFFQQSKEIKDELFLYDRKWIREKRELDTMEFSLNRNRSSMNSANQNLINHRNMNWSQFKKPVSHMCVDGAVVASWSLTQEVTGSNPFIVITNTFYHSLNLGKTRISLSQTISLKRNWNARKQSKWKCKLGHHPRREIECCLSINGCDSMRK